MTVAQAITEVSRRSAERTAPNKSTGTFRCKMLPCTLDGSRFECPFGDSLGLVALYKHWGAESHGFGLKPRRLLQEKRQHADFANRLFDHKGAVSPQHQRLCGVQQFGHFSGASRRFNLPGARIERHAVVKNRAVIVHGTEGLAKHAQKNYRWRVKMKNRFDVGTGFVDRLVQGRLRHGFFEVDEKQLVTITASKRRDEIVYDSTIGCVDSFSMLHPFRNPPA